MSLPKLLIVEDEVLIAEDIAELCKIRGHEIMDIALTPGRALNLLEEDKPDLVLLDINLMDDIDGIEVAEYLQKHTSLPYIFITSYTDEHTLERIAKLNPSGFIVKPFNKHQLYASIDLGWQKSQQLLEISLTEKLNQLDVKLTQRESEILKQYLKGKSVKEVCDHYNLSPNTVKYHVKNIYEKLKVHSKMELFILLK